MTLPTALLGPRNTFKKNTTCFSFLLKPSIIGFSLHYLLLSVLLSTTTVHHSTVGTDHACVPAPALSLVRQKKLLTGHTGQFLSFFFALFEYKFSTWVLLPYVISSLSSNALIRYSLVRWTLDVDCSPGSVLFVDDVMVVDILSLLYTWDVGASAIGFIRSWLRFALSIMLVSASVLVQFSVMLLSIRSWFNGCFAAFY